MSTDRLPNLILAGVNKAATTSLFMYLSAHPDICATKIKEVQYFLPLRYGATQLPPIGEYQKHFAHCQNECYRMEATPGYFYGGTAVAAAIKQQISDVKIILMFRDPISRLFSFYKFKKSQLELDDALTFEQYIAQCEALPGIERPKRENNVYWGIEGGFYANYIEDWFDLFAEDSIKVLFFEHLKQNPAQLLQHLCQWLGIEHESYLHELDFSIENKSIHYKNAYLQKIGLAINWHGESFWRSHPSLKKYLRNIYYRFNGLPHQETISQETRAYLTQLFARPNEKLGEILLRRGYSNLPEWINTVRVSKTK